MSRPNAFISRPASASTVREEAERKAREESVQVVRVTYDFMAGEALVYRQGRAGLKHQDVPPDVLAIIRDADEDKKLFYYAVWSKDDVKWDIIGPAPRSEGW